MKISARFTTVKVLEFRKGFYIDIVYDSKDESFDFWIYNENYGVKDLMFGVPVYNTGKMETIETAAEMAMANARAYIDYYEIIHMMKEAEQC